VSAVPRGPSSGSLGTLLLFTAGVLLSAALLFVVQPMFARIVLPRLGGTPATWTTCLLFFQVALLGGYLYVHLTAARLAPRTQVAVHVALLVAIVVAAPLSAPPATPPDPEAPVRWLLATLAAGVGLPFVAVSATAPLLQRWYAQTSGRDPYFLYAASNLGSLVGLLGYPLVVEPWLTLAAQRAVWSAGFVVLAMVIAGCGATAWRHLAPVAPEQAPAAGAPVTAADRAWWLALAFVPSTLLLGVTTHISTDVAAVPLLWVVPLSIYLLTFTAAFAAPPPISQRWTARLVAPAIVAATALAVLGSGWVVGLVGHLTAFAVIAMGFHRELADRRPAPAHLTQFFLIVAVGGALGGLFNAVAAPRLFTQVAEYPLMLALAAALRPRSPWRDGRDEPAALVIAIPLVVFSALAIAWSLGVASAAGTAASVTGYWLLASAVLAFANRRAAFAVAIAASVVASLTLPRTGDGAAIFAARSFFGVHRVIASADGTIHRLTHGTTLHGVERRSAFGCSPTSYYHPDGPIGQLFRGRRVDAGAVAVIGLGAGGLACYQPAEARWTFFEIDPFVERIARDPALFTFLSRAAGDVRVEIGDGRIGLAAAPAGAFDLVIADAFSSDAVPVHLLTREFMQLALGKVRPGGLVVFHISNRYLDLGPVLTASAASLGVRSLEQRYVAAHAEVVDSRWIVVGGDAAIARVAADPRWRAIAPGPRPWTDDFSNLLDVIAWAPGTAAAAAP
jgi:hypothetical protein